MEISLAAQLEKEARIDNSKNVTSFVKSAPKQIRYSLADSAESEDIGMDYHIQIITSADKQRVLKFLRRFFFRDEPLNYSIGLIPEGEDSTCAELEEYCSQSTVDSNLSLMAVSTSGAIIGVLLNGISTVPNLNETEEPDYIKECKNPKFKKILRLLNHIDREVNADGKFRGKKILETRIISVDSNWRGKGVGMALIRKTLEIGKEQNFDLARMDCTSMFSAKLCIKNAYELIYELKHEDYVNEDGKPIFNPAYPHTAVQIYVKKL